MVIRVESYSDKGLIAEINQDSILEASGERVSVFCVADGMGGHENGEKASGLIVKDLSEWQKKIDAEELKEGFLEVADGLERVITEANKKIYENYNVDSICGSTISTLMIMDEYYVVFSAGDSRIYKKNGFKFAQLTTDDVWENVEKKAEKCIDNGENDDCNRGKLTKAVGVAEKLVLNRITGRLKNGDVFLICCDGVYKYVDNEKYIKKLMRGKLFDNNRNPSREFDRLKGNIIHNGAGDNYSLVLIRIMNG